MFKVKYTLTDQIDKLKARLVIQGFSQVLDVNFDKVFSPTFKLDSLCTMLVIIAIEDLKVH